MEPLRETHGISFKSRSESAEGNSPELILSDQAILVTLAINSFFSHLGKLDEHDSLRLRDAIFEVSGDGSEVR